MYIYYIAKESLYDLCNHVYVYVFCYIHVYAFFPN